MNRFKFGMGQIGMAFLMLGSCVWAQKNAMVDSVVVTATRFPIDQKLSGRRVDVITAAEIKQLPVASIDELLRTVGGVNIQSRGGFGVQSDFTLRGSSFNGVLILIDGVRFNDPQTGHFLSDFPIPLAEIERIEVLRGPASALYGPDAFGGVIHILTKTANIDRPKAQANAQYGEHRYRNYGGFYSYKFGRTRISGAHTTQKSDGEPIFNGNNVMVTRNGEPLRTDFNQHASTFALRRNFRKGVFNLRTALDRRSFSAWHYYSASPADSARESTKLWWTQTSWQGNWDRDTKLTLNGGFRRHEDTYIFNAITPANAHTSRQFYGNALLNRRLASGSQLTSGVSVEQRSIKSNNLGNHADVSAGAFANVFWRPIKAMSVALGGRLDYDPAYGVAPTPSLNVAYNGHLAVLRASAGRAIRAPGYTERYLNTTLSNPRGRNIGNPELKPESAWAYEAGLDVYPMKRTSFHVTGFYRDTNNLIDYTKLAATDANWIARNLVRVQTQGLEVDLSRRIERNDEESVSVTASYAYLAATFDRESGIEYKYVLTHARHLVQGNLVWVRNNVQASLQQQWKQPLNGSAYAVTNIRMEWRPFRLFGFRLSAEVRNAFDARYTEVFDAPMPRRWWIFGIRY